MQAPRHHTSPPAAHPPLLQHGQGGGSEFSIDSIVEAAEKAAGGTPATGVDEAAWLAAFLRARRYALASGDAEAQASTGRVTVFRELLKLGGWGQGLQGLPVLRPACLVLSPPAPASPRPRLPADRQFHLPAFPNTGPAGNLDLEGPIYLGLKRRADGTYQPEAAYSGASPPRPAPPRLQRLGPTLPARCLPHSGGSGQCPGQAFLTHAAAPCRATSTHNPAGEFLFNNDPPEHDRLLKID